MLSRVTTRTALALALIVALVIWVAGEDFGGIFTGQGTDPNTGPLLILLAAAFWPLGKNRTGPAVMPPQSGPVTAYGRHEPMRHSLRTGDVTTLDSGGKMLIPITSQGPDARRSAPC